MSTHTSEVSDELKFVLATESPTSAQRRLALAVVAAIFAHGGKLIALSDGKDGASFEFVLPIASISQDSGRAE